MDNFVLRDRNKAVVMNSPLVLKYKPVMIEIKDVPIMGASVCPGLARKLAIPNMRAEIGSSLLFLT